MNNARPSRRLVAILAVSLCLNFLFIGIAAAVAIRWHLHPQEQAFRLAMRQFTRKLDHDDAKIMRGALLDHRQPIIAAWSGYRQSLRPLAEALQETPRNQDRLHAAEQATRERRIALGDAISDAVLDGAQKLSPAGRAALLRPRGADGADN